MSQHFFRLILCFRLNCIVEGKVNCYQPRTLYTAAGTISCLTLLLTCLTLQTDGFVFYSWHDNYSSVFNESCSYNFSTPQYTILISWRRPQQYASVSTFNHSKASLLLQDQ